MSGYSFLNRPIKQEKGNKSDRTSHEMSGSESSESSDERIPQTQSDSEFQSNPGEAQSPVKGNGDLVSLSRLNGLVACPSEFLALKEPGALSTTDLKDDNKEFYIFRFPTGMLNPEDLVDTRLRIGNKSSKIELSDKSYEVSTYEHSPVADAPTLFLPDSKGRLKQVDMQFSGQIMLKEAPGVTEEPQFDLENMRARRHVPPEIRQRGFFGVTGSPSPSKTPKKKKKKRSSDGHDKVASTKKSRKSGGMMDYAR